jgi:hypothetical protein
MQIYSLKIKLLLNPYHFIDKLSNAAVVPVTARNVNVDKFCSGFKGCGSSTFGI